MFGKKADTDWKIVIGIVLLVATIIIIGSLIARQQGIWFGSSGLGGLFG